MEKHYRFAGVELTVDIPEEWMYEADDLLAPFRVSQAGNSRIFRVEPVERLSAPGGKLAALLPGLRVYREDRQYVRYIGSVEDDWEKAYARAEESRIQVKVNEKVRHIGVKTVLNAIGAEHLLAEAGSVLFHCSYLDRNGKALLFTAPSGTGKSTQAELWQKYRGTEIVNGDRAAVSVRNGALLAEGIPFCGSSVYCKNASLPIGAVIYLSQAPETTIRRLRGREAFSRLWEGISVNTWYKQDLIRAADIVEKLAVEIPVYHLACRPDESAVIALEDALRKQGLP
jgi:hypothetical protein